MAEACWRCGTTEAETYRYCSARKEFVCINCERACEHFSSKLLKNGTNCKLSYRPENLYTYLSDSAVVAALREKYRFVSVEKAMEMFEAAKQRYSECDDNTSRADLRAKLAALEQIIDEGNRCLMH